MAARRSLTCCVAMSDLLRLASHLRRTSHFAATCPTRSLELLAGEQRGAAHSGLGAVAGEADARARADPVEDVTGGRLLGRAEQEVAGPRHSAADDDDLGVEGVDDVGDADAEALADDAQALERVGVAALGRAHDRDAVPDPALAAEPVEGPPGGQLLQRAGLRRALAG